MASKGKKLLITLGIIIALLITLRLILEPVVLHYVNRTLNEIPDYRGHVDDIDIHLYRGAYKIIGIKLEKLSGKIPEPFFESESMDLSIEWREIFNGSIVGEITFVKPKVNFVQGPTEETTQTGMDSSWTDKVKDLMPVRINKFEVLEGEVHYIDHHSSPKVDIFMTNINAVALNLTNSSKNDTLLPSTVDAYSTIYETGRFSMHMNLDPLKEVPTFDMNIKVEEVQLVSINDFLKAYGKFDVKKGTFGLYSEIAAKDGRFKGYVKPLIKDIDILKLDRSEGNILQIMWEAAVAGIAELLENQPRSQIATKIPLEGPIDAPVPDIFKTIGSLLRNAFIQALVPSIDHSINIMNLNAASPKKEEKGIIGKIFGNGDDDKSKKKEKEKSEKDQPKHEDSKEKSN